MVRLNEALARLRRYVEGEEYRGYDPYDTLNSRLPLSRFGTFAAAAAIQVQKRNPINIRPLLGIRKDYNAKAIGLFLHAYALQDGSSSTETRTRAQWLFEWLQTHRSQGYAGACWGYNFDWASPEKYLPAFTPSSVVTGFVVKGLHAYYQATGDERAIPLMRSACDFILQDLPATTDDSGVCYSYTPVKRDCCYNASLLAAEVLVRTYAITGEAALRDAARPAIDFVVSRQQADGRWNYSLSETGVERAQVDFHQGYVLDSIQAYMKYSGETAPHHMQALERGAQFYAGKQFAADGRSYWRVPLQWPTDIHHQAQGILTFARLAPLLPMYESTAHRIADWTLANMCGANGAFFYQVRPWMKNRIVYMRWGQAWMMLALSTLLAEPARRV